MGQHFGATPFLIAGPCVVESDDLNLRIGEALAELGAKLGVHVIYKASYDKANRSRLQGARGPGLERGLAALAVGRLSRLRPAAGVPVGFAAPHSGQQPGRGEAGASGGLREFIPPLLYAAAAAGADGFFLETHPDPDRAPSDGLNMLPLDQLPAVVSVALEVWQRAREAVRA